jgi:RecB family endonuclease NucS
MLQRRIDAADDAVALAASARALALDDELAAVEDPDAAVREAAETFRTLVTRKDVQALLQSGNRLHEVPFSFTRDGRLLRGTIDCLIMKSSDAGGEVVVVEFKTGRKRAEHQQQLDVYVDAARALFPEADVRGALLYP